MNKINPTTDKPAFFWHHYDADETMWPNEMYVACRYDTRDDYESVIVTGLEKNEDGYCYFTFNDWIADLPMDHDGFGAYLEQNSMNGFSDGWYKTTEEIRKQYEDDEVLQYLIGEMKGEHA